MALCIDWAVTLPTFYHAESFFFILSLASVICLSFWLSFVVSFYARIEAYIFLACLLIKFRFRYCDILHIVFAACVEKDAEIQGL
jgi:hypothetical protein